MTRLVTAGSESQVIKIRRRQLLSQDSGHSMLVQDRNRYANQASSYRHRIALA